MSSEKKLRKNNFWVYSTYFTEGLPYMITRFLASVYFTDIGVREAWLGFLNFLGIPWNFKFLWAPFLDIFSTKRTWLIKIQLVITLLVFLIAIIAGMGSPINSPFHLSLIAFLFVTLAFISATNDIAIDAYYMEGFNSTAEQSLYTGHRTLAYRMAVIYARSVLVGIAGVANWFYGFGAGALTMFLFFLVHRFFLPHFEEQKIKTQNTAGIISQKIKASFTSYFQQERIVLILVFVATYKLGDEILFSMNTPFLMRELLVNKIQLSWLAGFVGSFGAIAGTMLGAWWIGKVGLKKAIWPLTLLMNINILAYLILSEGKPLATTSFGITMIALVHGYENIAGGLGPAALTVYLMRLCSPEFKAAHFAIGTAIMSLGSTFIGGFSGILVEQMGYTNLFLLGFAATLPSMILLFWLPLKEK